jgi:hypothetical protein
MGLEIIYPFYLVCEHGGGDIGILFALGSFSQKDESHLLFAGPRITVLGANIHGTLHLVVPSYYRVGCVSEGWVEVKLHEHIRILEPSPCIDSRAQTF